MSTCHKVWTDLLRYVEGSVKPFKLNQAQHDPKGSYSSLYGNHFPQSCVRELDYGVPQVFFYTKKIKKI